jgi:hypothetical protein
LAQLLVTKSEENAVENCACFGLVQVLNRSGFGVCCSLSESFFGHYFCMYMPLLWCQFCLHSEGVQFALGARFAA